jgi:hypothetical protein
MAPPACEALLQTDERHHLSFLHPPELVFIKGEGGQAKI